MVSCLNSCDIALVFVIVALEGCDIYTYIYIYTYAHAAELYAYVAVLFGLDM